MATLRTETKKRKTHAQDNNDNNDKNNDTVLATLAKTCRENGVLTARVAKLEQEVANHERAFACLAKVAKKYAKKNQVLECLLAAVRDIPVAVADIPNAPVAHDAANAPAVPDAHTRN